MSRKTAKIAGQPYPVKAAIYSKTNLVISKSLAGFMIVKI